MSASTFLCSAPDNHGVATVRSMVADKPLAGKGLRTPAAASSITSPPLCHIAVDLLRRSWIAPE
eukprot:6237162-Amphidinium_carterae.1